MSFDFKNFEGNLTLLYKVVGASNTGRRLMFRRERGIPPSTEPNGGFVRGNVFYLLQ